MEQIRSAQANQALVLGSGADEKLPAPVLARSTATYPDVLPGVDVQVQAR